MTEAQPEDAGGPRLAVPENLTPYLVLLLVFLSIAGFFDSYATSFRYTMTTYVRRSFDVEMSTMVSLFSWVYLGSCLALIPRVLADIVGRRLMLWVTMVGLCSCLWLLSLARTPMEYGLLLTGLAIFYRSDIWLVILAEEAPPRHRGLYAAIMVTISGSGALVLGQLVKGMGDSLEAWRTVARFPLYGLILSIPIIFFLRETRHFEALRASRRGKGRKLVDWSLLVAPFRGSLLRPLLLISTVKMVVAGGVMATIAIIETEYLRVDNGFSQETVGALIQWDVLAATLGWLVAGSLSDRIGRHRCLYLLAAIYVASLFLFALLPSGSTGVMVFSVVHNFAILGVYAILRVVTMELFPNECRATASAWSDLAVTLFAALTSRALGNFMAATDVPLTYIILGAAVVVPLVLPVYALLPETRARRLEEI